MKLKRKLERNLHTSKLNEKKEEQILNTGTPELGVR
jgi:hypothetical protein